MKVLWKSRTRFEIVRDERYYIGRLSSVHFPGSRISPLLNIKERKTHQLDRDRYRMISDKDGDDISLPRRQLA